MKHAFLCLYSDKTWVFDQSERAQGPIYILKSNMKMSNNPVKYEVLIKLLEISIEN